MTKEQFKQYKEANEDLSNGQLLANFIRDLLANMPLTLGQTLRLGNIQPNGSYVPTDENTTYKNILELLTLATTDDVDKLLTYLKQLPSLETGNSISLAKYFGFIDGIKVPIDKNLYFNHDRDRQGIERFVREGGYEPTNAQFQEFLEGANERQKQMEKVRTVNEEYYKCTKPKVVKSTPYTDIGSEEGTLSESEEFEFNEESKPMERKERRDEQYR